jgi:hypothetical protein
VVAGPVLMVASPVSIVAADFNGDMTTDLAVASPGSNAITVFVGTAGGNFTPLANIPLAAGGPPRMLAVGDLNGDGKPDIATANPMANAVSVSLATKPMGCP